MTDITYNITNQNDITTDITFNDDQVHNNFYQNKFELVYFNNNYYARHWRSNINTPIIFTYNGIDYMMSTDFCIYSIENYNIIHYYGILNVCDEYNNPRIGSIEYYPVDNENIDIVLSPDIIAYYKNCIITSLTWT
jgi:hypothetical protein